MPADRATVGLGVLLGGLLGDAADASRRGRLHHVIVDGASPAIGVFAPEHRESNVEGDWYGEHAGKWLVAASRAAARSGDAVLRDRVLDVADHLIGLQQPDGYLGTYAPGRRFTVPQPPKPGTAADPDGLPTWDGAPVHRTWDIWIHAYLILGFVEVHRRLGHGASLAAARRIGDLCWRTLADGGIDITSLGNHHGMSATVLMHPAMALHEATGEPRYLDLALRVLRQADANPQLGLLRRAIAGADASEIATGKAYQLAWNLVGLAKIAQATGDADAQQAVDRLWQSIRDHHLTLGGGPWGGVAHRSREVFNAPGSFSPLAYVETCSTLAWIQLNRTLLETTGDARYADEIERSAYNDLLGAMAPDGEDWCYYGYANGRRVHTTTWRCCKSSGAMAWEEVAAAAAGIAPGGGLRLHLLGPGEVSLPLPDGGTATLVQRTGYPVDGRIEVDVGIAAAARFEIGIRIPGWATGATLQVGAESPRPVAAGSYATADRLWSPGDRIVLDLPMSPALHRQTLRNVQESRAPDGSPVRQEVLRHDYVALSRGPLVYATGLVDGYKTDETLRLPDGPVADWLSEVPGTADDGAPTLRLAPLGRDTIDFVPLYRADGRVDGGWRLTWLTLAPGNRQLS